MQDSTIEGDKTSDVTNLTEDSTVIAETEEPINNEVRLYPQSDGK